MKLLDSSWSDASYKEKLIANPIPAIEDLIGEKISIIDGKKLIVTDQSDLDAIYLNIPSRPQLDDVALTDNQLEMVAAGGWKAALLLATAAVLVATGAGAPAGVAIAAGVAAAGAGSKL